MTAEEVHDSPTGWVNKHIRDYLDSGGANGHRYNGRDSLLITTRGRISGQLRRTALFYGVEADRYVVVASNGGKPAHPGWYLNLLADPRVEVQVGADVFPAVGTSTEPEPTGAFRWSSSSASARTRTDGYGPADSGRSKPARRSAGTSCRYSGCRLT